MKKWIVLLPLLLLAGCTLKTPPYQASIPNVQLLNQGNVEKVKVGEFESPAKLNKISLRGSGMYSFIGNDYGDYLQHALEEELKLAQAWSDLARTVVSGTLIENDIDVTGFSEGEGKISVRFTVTDGDTVSYEKVVNAEHTFPSSFVGAIAIPNAQASYTQLVQKLLKQLFSDPEFIQAIQ